MVFVPLFYLVPANVICAFNTLFAFRGILWLWIHFVPFNIVPWAMNTLSDSECILCLWMHSVPFNTPCAWCLLFASRCTLSLCIFVCLWMHFVLMNAQYALDGNCSKLVWCVYPSTGVKFESPEGHQSQKRKLKYLPSSRWSSSLNCQTKEMIGWFWRLILVFLSIL